MTKKLVLVLLFVSVGAALEAQWSPFRKFYTSEGTYTGIITFSKNEQGGGQKLYDEMLGVLKEMKELTNVRGNAKLSKGQWECIGKLLASYDKVKGDIFSIMLSWDDGKCVVCIVEFTSNTQYIYWCITAEPK